MPSRTIIDSALGTSISHSFSPSDTGTYRIVRKESPLVIDSLDRTLSLVPLAFAGNIIAPDTICNGTTITLYDTNWVDNNGTSPTGWNSITSAPISYFLGGETDSVSYTALRDGQDTVVFISMPVSSFGYCVSDTAYKIITILPTSAGLISGSDSVCISSSINLTDTIGGGFWTTGDNSSISSSGILTGISIGLDTIYYHISNTCGSHTSPGKIVNIQDCSNVGIDNISNIGHIKVFPNPSSDFVKITSNFNIESVSITNLVGKNYLYSTYNNNEIEIDISKYSNGVYFIKINNEQVFRIVKQ
jgi:hypothetical protein